MIKRNNCMVQRYERTKEAALHALRCFADFCFVICRLQCGKRGQRKTGDIEYTVVKEEELPKELQKQIEQKKEDPMKISYGDQGMLYIVRGYGEKNTEGYQAEVRELYETKNAIYIRTYLKGPESEEEAKEKKTCPYVAVKMSYSAKKIRFDE